MAKKRIGKGFCISSEGITHLPHPTKDSRTLCLKPTQDMRKSWDGSLFADCDCCQAVVRREVELTTK
jgi:hypothetical protein